MKQRSLQRAFPRFLLTDSISPRWPHAETLIERLKKAGLKDIKITEDNPRKAELKNGFATRTPQ